MRITAFDRLKLKGKGSYDEAESEERSKKRRSGYTFTQTPGKRQAIVNHPCRKIAVQSVYRRMAKDPELSLDDACTMESTHPGWGANYIGLKFAYRDDPHYLADLASNQTHKAVAKKWGLNYNTVSRHRREEKAKR